MQTTSRSSPARPGPAPRPDPAADDEPTDASLIAASRTDSERFAGLFQRHAQEIMRYVARRLGRDAAEDVVAETFLVAFHQRHRYDAARPDARPWLYGIATNLIRRHRRAEVRALRVLARGGLDPVTEPFTDAVENRVQAGARSRALAAAIAGLPAKQREVLLLVTWAGLTYDEVAEALGVPSGTVRSRMNRIRRKLRDALGKEDHDG
ncbi:MULTISPECIES: RNA polymerase sigma factor [unclassified Actinomadura]|uniref:RNA polymerase sigma factor n=1 Tax=unclassified Actinomadura TaxID=2626254 RepID=UPI0011ED0696|nr:RNA polymerase sigma factor [Actinomadura sp. K4S16]